ncbi:MAG: DJ-1/PfpI family protein [Candidatus Omnitrophota bacterium]|nr:MAG: DJ-1/PfpI family protein [Candidatus Omnitrophota bacterium]
MSKKAIVILADGFEEIEACTCIDILRRAGIEVTVTGLDDVKVTGSRRIVILADTTLNQVTLGVDACVLPGGMPGASNLAASEKVTTLIKRMYHEGKIIAAICASPAIVLAPLGILKNKSATCFPGMEDKFSIGTIYKEDPVVTDANVITSRGPGTALKFALKIVENLAGKEISEKVQKATLAS